MAIDFVNKAIAGIVLALILSGIITSPDQLAGYVDDWELKCLSGAMECENGSNGDECLLLTGSVVLNRRNSPKWKGNSVEEVILAKDSGYWQYASVTRNGFKTKKASERTVMLAKYLLIYGPICPSNVVYQGQGRNGSGIYDSIPVKGEKNELFCYE